MLYQERSGNPDWLNPFLLRSATTSMAAGSQSCRRQNAMNFQSKVSSSFFAFTCIRGCQMVCFQTKNPNFGKNLEGLVI
jgi:hypothetical protein